MPTSLGSALPLLRGAGCFPAGAVESLGNCSLQCHRRPTYSWSRTSTSNRPIPYTLVPSTRNIPPPVSRSAHCLSSGCHPERSSRALLPFSRFVRARERSRGTSLRSLPHLAAPVAPASCRLFLVAFVRARYPPHPNGRPAPCGVRELAPAACRRGLPRRAPRINLQTPISRSALLVLCSSPPPSRGEGVRTSIADALRRVAHPSSPRAQSHPISPQAPNKLSGCRTLRFSEGCVFRFCHVLR